MNLAPDLVEEQGQGIAPEIGAAPALRLPRPKGRRSTAIVLALLASMGLHAAPLAIWASWPVAREAISAGDHAMEIEFVIAEAETKSVLPDTPIETLPDPESTSPASAEQEAMPELRKPEPPEPEAVPLVAEPVKPLETSEPESPRQEATIAAAPPPLVASLERQSAASEDYRAAVARHLVRFKRFPERLPRQIRVAQVIVRFAIAPDGRLDSATVETSSGYPAIDGEALAMLTRAVPFPLPDNAMTARAFTIPVTYRVRD